MVTKRNIPAFVSKMSQSRNCEQDPTSTRLDILQEVVEHVLRNKLVETKATLKAEAA